MMGRRAIFPLALALAAWAGAASTAAACDSASCSLLTRGENGLLPKKRLRLDVTFGYSDLSRLRRGSDETDSVVRPRVFLEEKKLVPGFHRDIDGYDRVVQLDATYGLSSRLNLTASVPLDVWHDHDVAHGDYRQQYGTTGLGDVLVGIRGAFGPRGLVAGLSIKAPTGSYRIGGEFGGGIQDPTLQPGTGAVDLVGSLQYGWSADALRLRFSAAASYQATTTNPLDYRFGNQAILAVGTVRPLTSRLSASFQAKVFHQDRNRYLDQGVPATGGVYVYATPGLRFGAPGGFSLYAFFLFVPYVHVNDAQLAPRAAVLTGVSKAF